MVFDGAGIGPFDLAAEALQAGRGDQAGNEPIAGELGFAEILGDAFVGPDGKLPADDRRGKLVKAFVLNDLPGALGMRGIGAGHERRAGELADRSGFMPPAAWYSTSLLNR